MAGVTDVIFRQICKGLGADVMVTEFVSAEGIMQADDRTRKYTEFTDEQRPVGVQLFGADGERMGEAAKKIIDWKQPDFIDINFGCPVNKVVSRNGGSSLLRDCPLLDSVASGVAKPDGLLVVDPNREMAFLRPLPVDRLWGVGRKTAARLSDRGIVTVGDVADLAPETLTSMVGTV